MHVDRPAGAVGRPTDKRLAPAPVRRALVQAPRCAAETSVRPDSTTVKAKPSFDFNAYMKERAQIIDAALDKSVPLQYPEVINEAMRYSLLAGGCCLVLPPSLSCRPRHRLRAALACACYATAHSWRAPADAGCSVLRRDERAVLGTKVHPSPTHPKTRPQAASACGRRCAWRRVSW